MRRWALAPVSLAVALAIAPATPLFTAQSSSAVSVEISARGPAVRERAEAAAALATANYTEWLGPPPFEHLAIRDHGTDGIVIRVPFRDSRGLMAIESQVAGGIARAWLARASSNEAWRNGAAAYLQSRVVEQLFDRAFLLKAYRYDGASFFGSFVPWSFRELPLSRWTAIADPVALAFASLERELGWPTLQGAMRVAAAGAADPIRAMSEATGRELAPVFAAAAATPIDRTIIALSSEAAPCGSPCYRTVVSIGPTGAVPFPLLVRVSFADGRSIDARWDGRADRLEFESAAPAIGAELDPARVWLLDRNPLNNARLVEPRGTNVPIVKWMARWIVWLQDALLTHTFPV